MLSDAEARNGYQRLIVTLSNSSLAWIVPQIQEEIAKGKVTTKPIRDISFRDTSYGVTESLFPEYNIPARRTRKGSSKEIVSTSETYTDQEQLQVLLNALQEVIDMQTIQSEILTALKIFVPQITAIEFIPDDSAVSVYTITEESLGTIMETISKLGKDIQEIKSEL